MKIAVTSLGLLLSGVIIFLFFRAPICVYAASHRVNLTYSIGLCPPFVNRSIRDVKEGFRELVDVGAPARSIEAALDQLGVSYSWDRFQKAYQGVIRHPSSAFHAISLKVYVDEQNRFKDIEVNDSFTTL